MFAANKIGLLFSQGSSASISYLLGTMHCTVGAYIPIPKGFTRDECRFFAAVKDASGGDVHGADIDMRTGKILDAKWHTNQINYLVIASHNKEIFSQ